MRITPSMLNSYTNRINPLSYARKTATTQNTKSTRMSAAAATARNRQTVNHSTAVDKYIKLGENAEALRSSANILGNTSKYGIFENARNTGSKDVILSQAKQMVGGYNNTMNAIKNDSTSLNRVYRQLMENAATENSESLSNIGIIVNKDKTLSIDEAKFQNASIDDLEAALGSGSRFTSRVGSMAENVSKNAISTATDLNSAYNSYGTYSTYGASGSYYNPYAGLSYGNSNYLSALLSGSGRFHFWG